MKIWIDITDLLSWRGHMTGIQRVVFGIASRYQRDEENVQFFYYDDVKRKFFEQEIDLVEWLKENEHSGGNPPRSLRSKIVDRVPYRLRNNTPKFVKKSVVKSAMIAINKKQQLQTYLKRRNVESDSRSEAGFQKDDLVIVLGNGWDKQNTFYDLGVLKKNIQFKLVNVVYDLIPIFEPQFFGGLVTNQYANYMFESVVNSDLLLPISKSTDRDISRFCDRFDIEKPMSSVIRLGDEVDEISEKKPNWMPNNENYILCVGTIEIRKNHNLLYYSYKNLINKGVKVPKLVIVGKRGWYTDDVMMLFEQDTEVRRHIQIVQNTSDAELVWLYNNCQFTVYPSLYEGWGLPVAESLARGQVVLASNSSSVPEAGGNLAEYFSPYNAVECGELIEKFLDNKRLESQKQKIEKEYKVTTWEDCYAQTKKFINKLI